MKTEEIGRQPEIDVKYNHGAREWLVEDTEDRTERAGNGFTVTLP
jgi:hypothetical protein